MIEHFGRLAAYFYLGAMTINLHESKLWNERAQNENVFSSFIHSIDSF